MESQALTDSGETALPESLPGSSQNDPELAIIVDSWEALPEPVRAGIVALVKATKQTR